LYFALLSALTILDLPALGSPKNITSDFKLSSNLSFFVFGFSPSVL